MSSRNGAKRRKGGKKGSPRKEPQSTNGAAAEPAEETVEPTPEPEKPEDRECVAETPRQHGRPFVFRLPLVTHTPAIRGERARALKRAAARASGAEDAAVACIHT